MGDTHQNDLHMPLSKLNTFYWANTQNSTHERQNVNYLWNINTVRHCQSVFVVKTKLKPHDIQFPVHLISMVPLIILKLMDLLCSLLSSAAGSVLAQSGLTAPELPKQDTFCLVTLPPPSGPQTSALKEDRRMPDSAGSYSYMLQKLYCQQPEKKNEWFNDGY